MSVEKNAGGFRLDDCRALFSLHNQIMSEVSRMSPNDEATILRRLRTLAYWVSSMGNAAFEADPFAAGMAEADRFWQRHGIDPRITFDGPKRGEGDAVE